MCGISGIMNYFNNKSIKSQIAEMTSSLGHRGPDKIGTWIDADSTVALGHSRLSIIDLSPTGDQPMLSTSGRYVIAFNGEIYNYIKIKNELILDGNCFKGSSDTEVLLKAIEKWGIVESLSRISGMFAFALWDKKEQMLHLCRDRLGEKPLYYGWIENTFVFGSELRAIRKFTGFKAEIDRKSLSMYLRYSYVPTPFSIYKGIYKLEPATILSIGKDGKSSKTNYWSMDDVIERSINQKFRGSETEAINVLDNLLKDVIRNQMVADVPLGAFLSGGIDSTTVVALMQHLKKDSPVKTFSIGFNQNKYNEARFAKEIASYLGTEHTELYVTAQDAMNVIPMLPSIYDEPFSDVSQIPTFLVSELAKKHVTVSLSGDGGDELFAGYNRYRRAEKKWQLLQKCPQPTRRLLSQLLVKNTRWLSNLNSNKLLTEEKIIRLADRLVAQDFNKYYFDVKSTKKFPDNLVINGGMQNNYFANFNSIGKQLDITHQMMYLDTINYLPDDILVKLDRASMAVSLESRVPLLDHRIVEFAWSLPLSMKIKNNTSKWILKELLYKYVPKHLVDRPKQGFSVPIGDWLRGPLKEWAESLLDERKLKEQGYFNVTSIRAKWDDHIAENNNWGTHIWSILMFQAWLEGNL